MALNTLDKVLTFFLDNDKYKALLALWQTESESITVEFDCESPEDEPKLQRLGRDYNGVIVFLRHLLPYSKGSAGLMPPYNTPYCGKKHYLHRTLLVLDVTEEKLQDFEWVSFPINFQSLLVLLRIGSQS